MPTLTNDYANCYLNSVLQLLITDSQILDDSENEDFMRLSDTMKTMNCIKCQYFIPIYKKINPCVVVGRQEDAFECLEYFLDSCVNKDHFELKFERYVQQKKLENDNLIEEGEVSISTFKENCLLVPICSSLQKSVDSYFEETQAIINLDGSVSPYTKFYADNTPLYLFVALCRFNDHLEKDPTNIHTDGILTYNQSKYECISFILHLGTKNSGHYVNFKKLDQKWYLYDDTCCHDVTMDSSMGDAYVYLFKKI